MCAGAADADDDAAAATVACVGASLSRAQGAGGGHYNFFERH